MDRPVGTASDAPAADSVLAPRFLRLSCPVGQPLPAPHRPDVVVISGACALIDGDLGSFAAALHRCPDVAPLGQAVLDAHRVVDPTVEPRSRCFVGGVGERCERPGGQPARFSRCVGERERPEHRGQHDLCGPAADRVPGAVLRKLWAVDQCDPVRVDMIVDVADRSDEVVSILPGPAVQEGVVKSDAEPDETLDGCGETEIQLVLGQIGQQEKPVTRWQTRQARVVGPEPGNGDLFFGIDQRLPVRGHCLLVERRPRFNAERHRSGGFDLVRRVEDGWSDQTPMGFDGGPEVRWGWSPQVASRRRHVRGPDGLGVAVVGNPGQQMSCHPLAVAPRAPIQTGRRTAAWVGDEGVPQALDRGPRRLAGGRENLRRQDGQGFTDRDGEIDRSFRTANSVEAVQLARQRSVAVQLRQRRLVHCRPRCSGRSGPPRAGSGPRPSQRRRGFEPIGWPGPFPGEAVLHGRRSVPTLRPMERRQRSSLPPPLHR